MAECSFRCTGNSEYSLRRLLTTTPGRPNSRVKALMASTHAPRFSALTSSKPSRRSKSRFSFSQVRVNFAGILYLSLISFASQSKRVWRGSIQVARLTTTGKGWLASTSARATRSRASSSKVIVLPEPGSPKMRRARPSSSNISPIFLLDAINWPAVSGSPTTSSHGCSTASCRTSLPRSSGGLIGTDLSSTPSIQNCFTFLSRIKSFRCSFASTGGRL